MRIAIDGTSAATQFAGVGRYTRELLRALLQQEHGDRYQVLCAARQDYVDALEREMPPGQWREYRRFPISERWSTAAWQRLRVPVPIDVFLDDHDVFHGPDFVLPPTRRPSVVTIHDLSYLKVPELGDPHLVQYLTAAVPRTLTRADQVIAVSAQVAAELVDAYPFVRSKIRAIPNGVIPPDRLYIPRVSETRRPTILTVGTIEPRKNHLTLLEAMQWVWASEPDAQLIIAGRVGWQADAIVSRIQDAVARSNVTLVTAPPDNELERLYQSATVFAYPSMYEGFGLPVLEAMIRGVPVVTSDTAALRETGGEVAMYANPRDPEEVAERILTAIRDENTRDDRSDAGRERAARFTWTETARRTRLAYKAASEGS